MRTRSAGLLLHPTSLPCRFGVGDLGPASETFLDWAADAGQSLWQVLPVGPTGYGNSPYGLLSAFAGNPLLLSPERLVEDGLLSPASLEGIPSFPPDQVRFEEVAAWKKKLVRKAFDAFRRSGPSDLRSEAEAFAEAPEQACWLADWTLFSALKSENRWRAWTSWDEDVRDREPAALEAARRRLADEIAYRTFVQFLFFRQWARLRQEAHARRIDLMGDIPIYVALDSADVWAHRRLFRLDETGRPTAVAGVPPDYFCPDGQLWGNPLFDWDQVEEEGFAWWIERVRANQRTADLIRIDHFRGFAAYWSVPAGARTAASGAWRPGPGLPLFEAIRAALGPVAFVAEDLGDIDDSVRALLEATGFPGMRVLQFAFGDDDHEYQPHRFTANTVVYTGTHDNDTTTGWWRTVDERTRTRLHEYLGSIGTDIGWELIRTAYTSVADRAVIPVQDVFCLGSEARMNTPGTESANWSWRALAADFTPGRAAGLRRMAELTGRAEKRAPKDGSDAAAAAGMADLDES